jgi:hypothetical protein
MALMVIHQGHESALAAAVLQHVLWLLECAAGGLLPAAVCTPSWQVAAAACVQACTSALSCLDMLGMFADRCASLCGRLSVHLACFVDHFAMMWGVNTLTRVYGAQLNATRQVNCKHTK